MNSRGLSIARWGGVIVWLALLGALPTDIAAQQQAAPTRTLISWVSDARDVRQGDIVTILIDELTLASADRNESNEQGRGRDVTVRAGVGGTSTGGSLRSGTDAQNSRRGESSRRERFQAELSVQVVEIMANGHARIEGRRRLQIDDHEQDVIVRGIIRTQDISAANTIESWRVANAELLYDSNEELGSAGGGIWSKILDIIIP